MVKISCGPPSAFGIDYVFQCGACKVVYLLERQAERCCMPHAKKEVKKPTVEIQPHGETRTTRFTVFRDGQEFRVTRTENNEVEGSTFATYDVRKRESNEERMAIIEALNIIDLDK